MRRLKQISILGISLLASGAMVAGANALEFKSNEIPLTFNFETTMTVTLSGESLVIDELSPNTSKNSNVVDITVVTNDMSGYTLRATTGNASNVSTNLVATNDNFAMISDGVTALSAGEWGYTTNGGTTFGSLPLYTVTPKVVNSSSAPTDATSGKTSFQIGAYAKPSQAQGDYTNVINFVAVTNTVSPEETNMQDATATSMASLMPSVGDTANLVDTRDGQTYSVAKLADGKYWMTSNLNLAGGTVLSNDKSNVPSANYYTLPVSATKNSDNANLTDSSQFGSDSGEYVFNSNNNTTTCNSSTPCNSYYSWLVATAGGDGVTGDGGNARYSICPKGWRLPTATTSNANVQSNNNWQTGDFWKMATQYGLSTSSYYENPDNSPTFYSQAGPGTTPNFLLAGSYSGGSFFSGGSEGLYWSATSLSSTSAYSFYFGSSTVYSATSSYRGRGFSVRCIFGA